MPTSPESGRPSGPALVEKRRSPAANAFQELVIFVYPVALTIVLTPVILHFIGPEEYGIFALANVFVSFVGLLDIGMGPAIVRFLSVSLATSNFSDARAVLGVGFTFYTAVGVIGIVLALIGGQLLPDILSLSPDLHGTATFAITVAGIGFFFTVIRSPYASIPGALQRFDTATYVNLISTTAGAIGTVTVLTAGWGLRGLMIVTALQPVLSLVLYLRGTRRLVPELRVRPAYEGPLMRRMVSFSAYSFISNMAGAVLFQIDKIILGSLGNVSLVTYYVVPGNVAQRLHTGVAQLASVILPVSADLHARQERAALGAVYVRATRVLALVVVSLCVPVFVFARQLLFEWVGESFAAESFGTLRVLIITYALLALTALPYYVSLGIGRPRILAVFNVITATINVVLIFILIPAYGLIGAAFAYLAATVTVPFLIIYLERRVLALERSPWPSLILRLGLVALAQAACCLLLRPLATGLAQVIILLFVGVAIGPALALLTGYLRPEDRATLLRLMRIRKRSIRRRTADSTVD